MQARAMLSRLTPILVVGAALLSGPWMAGGAGEAEAAGVRNPDGVALIIGNEDYEHRDVPDVAYAHRDAEAFRRYVVDVLGFDPENVLDLRDATRRQLFDALGTRQDPRSLLWSYLVPKRGSDVVVFYSGHGVPGVNDGRGYLLPVDADPRAAEDDGYPIDLLYENIGGLADARSVRVYLDACFSGGSHEKGLIGNARPVFVRATLPEELGEKVTSLAAASGEQVASWDDEAKHGLFTDHLLDALYGAGDVDGDGRVTAREAKAYLDEHMTRAARRQFRRIQEASLMGAERVALASASADGVFPVRPVLDEGGGGTAKVEGDDAMAALRAVQSRDLEGLRAALAGGADVNARDREGLTALIAAANEGYVLMVPALLEAGANPDLQAVDGATALLLASQQGYVKIVKQLLEAGADVSITNPRGNTAWEEAQARGHVKVVAAFEAVRQEAEERKEAEAKAAELARQQAEAERLEREREEAERRREAARAEEKALGLSQAQRVQVQVGLGELGHDVGTPDGVFGSRTRAGIGAYQKGKGLSETGHLTREQAEALAALGEEAQRRAEAEAKGPKVGEVIRDCAECPELVVVPSGTYRMGSPSHENRRDGDEGPVHEVVIGKPFAVGVFEVTFSEWDACVRGGGCGRHSPSDGGWGRGNRPVINVSWEDVQLYVSWLSRRTGKEYRLPSESEWEYVARAGTTTPFHFGTTLSTRQANYDGNFTYGSGRKGSYRKKTVPVGSFEPNRFGLYDVHGNVWEWVQDCWNRSYDYAPRDGRARERGNCSERVLRGGSWNDSPGNLRSANRERYSTGYRINLNGFRVARTLTP